MKTIGQLDEFEGDVGASAADILLEMECQQQSGRLNAQQLFDAARTGMAKDRAGEVRLNDEVSTGGTAFLTVDPDLSEYFVVTCFNGEHIQLTFNKPAAAGAVATVAIKFDKTYVDTAPGALTLLMQDGEVYKLTGSTLDLSAGAVPNVLFATIWGAETLVNMAGWELAAPPVEPASLLLPPEELEVIDEVGEELPLAEGVLDAPEDELLDDVGEVAA